MNINVPFFFFSLFLSFFFLLIIPSNRPGRQTSQGSVESGTIAPSNEYNIIIFRSRLIKFPGCENGIRNECASSLLPLPCVTIIITRAQYKCDPLLTAVNLQSQCEIECFFFPSLSLSRADSTRNIRVTWREKSWRARKNSGNGSP